MKNTLGGDADVNVVTARRPNQALKLFVLKDIPLFFIRERGGFGLCRFLQCQTAIRGWHVHFGALVVWATHAAGQAGHQQADTRVPEKRSANALSNYGHRRQSPRPGSGATEPPALGAGE